MKKCFQQVEYSSEGSGCTDISSIKVNNELVASHLLSRCKGRVVVSGLGKSGHVGRKTAATFASLGIPAFFLHATEGAHGDPGMSRDDLGYFLSNSGETRRSLLT